MTQSTRNALVSAYKETKNLRKTIYGIILKAQQRMCTLKKPQDGTFSFNRKRTLKKPVTGKIWDHQFPAWSHRDTGNHFLKNERLSVSGCFWGFFSFLFTTVTLYRFFFYLQSHTYTYTCAYQVFPVCQLVKKQDENTTAVSVVVAPALV